MEEDNSNKLWVYFEDKYQQYNKKIYNYFEYQIDKMLEKSFLKYFYGQSKQATQLFMS